VIPSLIIAIIPSECDWAGGKRGRGPKFSRCPSYPSVPDRWYWSHRSTSKHKGTTTRVRRALTDISSTHNRHESRTSRKENALDLHSHYYPNPDRWTKPPIRQADHANWSSSRPSREQLDNQRVQAHYAQVTTGPSRIAQVPDSVHGARAEASSRGSENTPLPANSPQYDTWGFLTQHPHSSSGEGTPRKPSNPRQTSCSWISFLIRRLNDNEAVGKLQHYVKGIQPRVDILMLQEHKLWNTQVH
jgi:hypothetical protein